MLNVSPLKWNAAGSANLLAAGHSLNTPALLFEKIEDSVVEAQVKKLLDTKKANEAAQWQPSPQKPAITFDDFTKLDLRVGTILAAEKVAKADKLLKLTIDTGLDKRTVVSGIAAHYSPEEIIGRKVTIIINLAPRSLKGIESQGMILMAENSEGKLCFVEPSDAFGNGSEIR
jgi:methionyl-tRNA synthetase